MKILVIPDVHGRKFWKNAVSLYENDCDKIIFLGDYLDPYEWEGITRKEAISNFEEIIEYKRNNKDKVILLLGNHDMHYYAKEFHTRSRYDSSNAYHISDDFNKNRSLFQLAYEEKIGDKNFLFTHAGVMNSWVKRNEKVIGTPTVESLNHLLEIPDGIKILTDVSNYRTWFGDETGSIVWSDMREKQDNPKDADVEGTINFSFASTGIKIDIIFNSKDSSKCDENWQNIQSGVSKLLSGENLIRFMAIYVSGGKVNNGDERKALLGTYYDEVMNKVNWAHKTAKDVWKGQYPNGEANRKAVFGADYDLIQFWVNDLTPFIHVPTNLSKIKDNSGQRYLIKNVPTAKGKITWKGYDQHGQGSNPYSFDGSGCGFMSFYSVISTIKGYNDMPIDYANKKLNSVTGGNKCPISIWAGCKLLKSEGIKFTWVKGPLTTNEVYKDILNHLSKGMPVIVSLSKDNRAGKEDKRYTNYAHYSLLIGVTKDKMQVLDAYYRTTNPGTNGIPTKPNFCMYNVGSKKCGTHFKYSTTNTKNENYRLINFMAFKNENFTPNPKARTLTLNANVFHLINTDSTYNQPTNLTIDRTITGQGNINEPIYIFDHTGNTLNITVKEKVKSGRPIVIIYDSQAAGQVNVTSQINTKFDCTIYAPKSLVHTDIWSKSVFEGNIVARDIESVGNAKSGTTSFVQKNHLESDTELYRDIIQHAQNNDNGQVQLFGNATDLSKPPSNTYNSSWKNWYNFVEAETPGAAKTWFDSLNRNQQIAFWRSWDAAERPQNAQQYSEWENQGLYAQWYDGNGTGSPGWKEKWFFSEWANSDNGPSSAEIQAAKNNVTIEHVFDTKVRLINPRLEANPFNT